jgi:exopolysaccharide biosynthesis polyprenyl glycosylphosphotransferase
MSPVSGARQSGSHQLPEQIRKDDGVRVRQFRKTPHPFVLPDFDVRLRREISQRRLFKAIGRQSLRVIGLHVGDAITTAFSAWLISTLISLETMPGLVPIQVGFVLLGLGSRRAYEAAHARRDPVRVLAGVSVAVAALAVMTAFPPRLPLTPRYLLAFGLTTIVALIVERRLVDLVMRQIYQRGVGLRRALIVGGARQVEEVTAALRNDRQQDHRILGAISAIGRDEPGTVGALEDLELILLREDPAELIIATALPTDVLQRVSETCVRYGVTILALPTWNSGLRGWIEPIRLGELPAFCLHPRRLEMPALLVKRSADLILTSISMVVVLPLIGILAAAIKLDSRGPVFFRQVRVGLGGRRFMLWKLRSMTHDPNRTNDQVAHLNTYSDSRLFKSPNDPRITLVGKFLRRFSLDELPQLFNVLTGDMSLVGPRPPMPEEVRHYDPKHFVRLTVVPGVTGPWQTSGRNLITDFEEVVRLEQRYIENWSLGLDLQIMAKTVLVVLSGEGAY